MYKVGIIGYFAIGKSKAGGQEAKTCSLDRAMKEAYGPNKVLNIDTTNWKKHPLKLLFQLLTICFRCQNIIILPAQNSIRIFVPILTVINHFFHRRLIYSVVGGWLPEFLEEHQSLQKQIRRLDAILVETKSMKDHLRKLKINNVEVVPNFKFLNPVDLEELNLEAESPYKVCTFSRVMEEKGIEDAIETVKNVNKKYGKTEVVLHIYGKIDDGYREHFAKIRKEFPDYIEYKGMVEPDESIAVVKNYSALLFPTHYYTEGVPGTIIDAYMSGVPIITALWGNYQDVFEENITGWGYTFGNQKEFQKCLEHLVTNPEEFFKMKKSVLAYSSKFIPEYAMEIIAQYIE